MGRKPASADYGARLNPPATLTPPERDLFARLVQATSPEHFVASDLPLLVEFCRASCLADRAAAELARAPIVGGKPSPWLQVQARAQAALVALSARLRLCPQSRFDRLVAGTSARRGAPADPWPGAGADSLHDQILARAGRK